MVKMPERTKSIQNLQSELQISVRQYGGNIDESCRCVQARDGNVGKAKGARRTRRPGSVSIGRIDPGLDRLSPALLTSSVTGGAVFAESEHIGVVR